MMPARATCLRKLTGHVDSYLELLWQSLAATNRFALISDKLPTWHVAKIHDALPHYVSAVRERSC
jgi:hypothetical protein